MEAGERDLPPVVLLHGIGANSLHWRYQLAAFAERFRVIAWNAPGYMLSDNLRAETPNDRDYADALDHFLNALGIASFGVVANSFGTAITQRFAYYHPGRITRAIFTGTSVAKPITAEQRTESLRARAAMIKTGGYRFGDRVTALLGSTASPRTIALVQQTLRATNPAGFMQAALFLMSGDVPPFGAGLTMPRLLIQGEEDRVTPAETNAELLAAAVPEVKLVMLAGCGHLPDVEAPARFNELTEQHLCADA